MFSFRSDPFLRLLFQGPLRLKKEEGLFADMEGDSRVRERSWAIRLLPWQIGKREASCTTATEMQCSAHRVVGNSKL